MCVHPEITSTLFVLLCSRTIGVLAWITINFLTGGFLKRLLRGPCLLPRSPNTDFLPHWYILTWNNHQKDGTHEHWVFRLATPMYKCMASPPLKHKDFDFECTFTYEQIRFCQAMENVLIKRCQTKQTS